MLWRDQGNSLGHGVPSQTLALLDAPGRWWLYLRCAQPNGRRAAQPDNSDLFMTVRPYSAASCAYSFFDPAQIREWFITYLTNMTM